MTQLPKQIDPIRMTDKKTKLQGEITLAEMQRLSDLLSEKTGKVEISLDFTKDSHGFRSICGNIRTQVWVVCQRCLLPMSLDLEIPVKLSPVRSEAAAKQLPEEFEPLIVTEEPISLLTLVEDELLLNLPLVAKHELGQCPTVS